MIILIALLITCFVFGFNMSLLTSICLCLAFYITFKVGQLRGEIRIEEKYEDNS